MNSRKLKILMISHIPIDSIYGSGSSLRLHLESLEQTGRYEFTLICPKPVVNGESTKMTEIEIMETWPSIKNVKQIILPYRFNYDGVSHSIDNKIRTRAHMFLGFMVWRKLIKSIKHHPPDIIYLSSLVLAPLALWFKQHDATRSIPILGHVRELLRKPLSTYDVLAIEASDMFICIDQSTKNRLLDVMNGRIEEDRITIIQNPFSVSSVEPDPSLFTDIDLNKTLIFAIAGLVSKDKGAKMVCETFLKAKVSDAILLVVGKLESSYGQEVKDLCTLNQAKLRWLGEQPDLVARGFFNGVNVLVRGDESFRTGRTVYEALFSGGEVILPGDKSDLALDSALMAFRDRVTLYKPKDSASLISAFKSFMTKFPRKLSSLEVSKPNNNLVIYRQQIEKCYDRVLNCKPVYI